MKLQNKIVKARARFIRQMTELIECDNLIDAYKICKMSSRQINAALKKYEPETYIKLNKWIDEDLVLSGLTEESIKELEFDQFKKSIKFQRFLKLFLSGTRKTVDFERQIPCTKKYVSEYKKCLRRAIKRKVSNDNEESQTNGED